VKLIKQESHNMLSTNTNVKQHLLNWTKQTSDQKQLNRCIKQCK